MDVIESARELGKLIQQDSRYINLQNATAANEADTELQKRIADFNALRVAITTEGGKADRDNDKLAAMNAEFQALYTEIMSSPAMVNYNEAREEANALLNYIYQIITGSFNGFDPDTIQYQAGGCSGSCSSCAGCEG
jgi:cell fate (sporulation/competence/biofilm development) regulator YlbF (YheA/YmcA/DUF963 family)